MQRWFFKIYYFTSAAISIVALCRIFAGQVHARDPRTVADNNDTSTINSTSWPFEMRLRMIDHVCTTPTSNFSLTEEELIAAWHLPPKTRLSNRMLEIARCHLATRRISSDFDPNQCDCVDWRSIGLVVVPLILHVFSSSFRFASAFGLPMDKIRDVRRLYWTFVFWPMVIWCCVGFHYFNIYLSFSYTRYGYTEPSFYFDLQGDYRVHVIDLLYFGFYVSVVEVVCRARFEARRNQAVNPPRMARWLHRFIISVLALRGREEEQRRADADRVITVVIAINLL